MLSLCLALGCTPRELGQRMTAAEFNLFCGYRQMRPWGGELDEFLAGSIAATVANYAGKTRPPSAPPAVPADFMPFAAREQPPEAEQEPDPVEFFSSLSFPERR